MSNNQKDKETGNETDKQNLHKTHRPRKRFGQNFLSDPSVVAHIIRAIAPRDHQHLVEIGPGRGALTEPIIATLPTDTLLDLIELDRDLAAELSSKYHHLRKVTVHQDDALHVDFNTLRQTAQQPLRIFGNLPYNISTPLIFHLINQTRAAMSLITDMHFMLQKEVVDRLSAMPGSKTYGRLSIMAQYYCEVESLFTVPPEAFTPRPKVTSAVVRLRPYDKLPVTANHQPRFDEIVKAAFAQRRKTLRNNLRQYIAAEQLDALAIDPGARAETLTIDEFVRISNAIRTTSP